MWGAVRIFSTWSHEHTNPPLLQSQHTPGSVVHARPERNPSGRGAHFWTTASVYFEARYGQSESLLRAQPLERAIRPCDSRTPNDHVTTPHATSWTRRSFTRALIGLDAQRSANSSRGLRCAMPTFWRRLLQPMTVRHPATEASLPELRVLELLD